MPRGSLALGKSVVEKMTCLPGSTNIALKISAGIAAPRAAQADRNVSRPFGERLFPADHFSSRAQPRSDVRLTNHGTMAEEIRVGPAPGNFVDGGFARVRRDLFRRDVVSIAGGVDQRP